VTDDSAAVERCRAGDADGFRWLVERYEREAVAHALAIVGNREDAVDAVQDAFVDAFRAIGRFDAKRRFYPWFYVILRNRCFKLLERKRRRLGTVSLDHVDVEIVQSEAAGERMADLQDALLELSPEDREIILLKHVDGLTCDELAERLEIPAGTVMSRLYHARRRLRERLA
jgi:RNA polymerase sigma-70 factor (ECF subfamily)